MNKKYYYFPVDYVIVKLTFIAVIFFIIGTKSYSSNNNLGIYSGENFSIWKSCSSMITEKNLLPKSNSIKAFSISTSFDIGTAVLVSWTASSIVVSSYTIQYRMVGSTTWLSGVSNINERRLINLLPLTQYECRVLTYDVNGGYYSTSPICTFTTGKVDFTTSLDIGATITLAWTNFNSWATYSVNYRLVGSTTWLGLSPATNQTKLINLSPNSDYECRVQVYKNGFLWGISQTGTFHTGTVQYIKSQDMGNTIKLEWTPFPGIASSYNVQLSVSGSGTWWGLNVSSNPAKITGLIPNTDYLCRVGVYMNGAYYGLTQTGAFHTGKVDIYTITDLPTSMLMGWISLAPWATSYELQYCLPPNPVNYNWVTSASTSTNSVTIPVLSGQDYFMRVKVYINGVLWGTTEKVKVGRNNPVKSEIVTENFGAEPTSMSIYPNPFIEQLSMSILVSEESKCIWAIYDITGRQLKSGNESLMIGENILQIEASDLREGIYLLNTIINDQRQSFRIIKQ